MSIAKRAVSEDPKMPVYDWTRVKAGIFHDFALDAAISSGGLLCECAVFGDLRRGVARRAGILAPRSGSMTG